MTTKRHCDICDRIIEHEGGYVDSRSFGAVCNRDYMDLCWQHYMSVGRILIEWQKFEKGWPATWPTR